MHITVRYFASIREAIGTGSESCETLATDLAGLRAMLSLRSPAHAEALARGRAEEALADFHRALAIAPDDRDLLLDTAEVYRRLGRPQRALATLAILGESYGPNQTPPQVLVLEGLAQEALERPIDAVESYREAVARGLSSPEITARLASLERETATDRRQTIVAETPADATRQ